MSRTNTYELSAGGQLEIELAEEGGVLLKVTGHGEVDGQQVEVTMTRDEAGKIFGAVMGAAMADLFMGMFGKVDLK